MISGEDSPGTEFKAALRHFKAGARFRGSEMSLAWPALNRKSASFWRRSSGTSVLALEGEERLQVGGKGACTKSLASSPALGLLSEASVSKGCSSVQLALK